LPGCHGALCRRRLRVFQLPQSADGVEEFGIRSALGAQKRDLLAVDYSGMPLGSSSGADCGVLIFFWVLTFLEHCCTKSPATDALSYVIAVLAILFLCLGSGNPARERAARVDIVRVLREP